MIVFRRTLRRLVLFATLATPFLALAQQRLAVPANRILQPVDDTRLTTLTGNTHPLALPQYDQGSLAPSTPLHRILLVLERSPDQQTALQRLLDQQQDPSSSAYHQWLTPQSFGDSFGPSERDLATLTAWLAAQGFTAIQVNPARTLVEFSATAATLSSAFHTAMHRYQVNGVQRFANASDPRIPTALVPVVAGILSLNNFPRKPASHPVGRFRQDPVTHTTTRLPDSATPSFTYRQSNDTYYAITPYDFATIYNVLPLWNASTPIDGSGQTIAIVGETDINPADFVNFRKLFNLPLGNTATPTGTQYLNIIYNGPNPGVLSDEGEADIDTQWSSAVARSATIDYVVSASTEVTQGTDLSAAYIVNNNLAPVLSYSYGQCELFLGTAGNAFYNSLWQQAAAQGISVLVASADSGSAACDTGNPSAATHGLAVNGLGSTPYNTAVGGTDFDLPTGGTAYFSSTNNPASQASALSYIPETTWNDSCANSALPLTGLFLNQTPEQICNSSTAASSGLLTVTAASGGASRCIRSNGTTPNTCAAGYPKPSWQTGTGVPADGARDLPDVSLFSSDAFYGAFYLVCQQSLNPDGRPCSLAAPAYDFAGYGGTSVASPAFAGILALVNQKTGSRLGNPNYVLYNLASRQSAAGTSCNTASPAATCVFHDITTNTIAMPCRNGSPNCTVLNPSDAYGILSGYNSAPGYDLATGLGSVNAANLVNAWSSSSFSSTAITLALTPTTLTHGSPVAASGEVTATAGTPTGSVSINAAAINGAVSAPTLASGAYSASIANFPGGTYAVQAHYAGDGTFAASDSNAVLLTVSPEPSTTTLRPLLYNLATGQTSLVASQPYGSLFLLRSDVAGASRQGTATGNITLTDNASPLDGGSFQLNSSGYTEDETTLLAPGTHTLLAAYSGDPSFNPSHSAPATLTITRAATTLANNNTATAIQNQSFPLTLQILPQGDGLGASPTGTITVTTPSSTPGSVTTGPITLGTFTLAPADHGSKTVTLIASQLAPGRDSLTATYPGDANYLPSTGTIGSVFVTAIGTPIPSITRISLSTTSAPQGATVLISASVSPTSPAPTGTTQLLLDGNLFGQPVPLASSTATLQLPTATLPPGTHSIAVLYSGDNTYLASTSSSQTLTLAAPVASFTLSPSNATATVASIGTSQPVTLTINPLNGFSGSITFACTSGLPAGASCSFAPAKLSPKDASSTTAVTFTTTAVTAPSVARNHNPPSGQTPISPWNSGITLATLLALLLPNPRSRKALRHGISLTVFTLALLAGTLTGCGVNSSTIIHSGSNSGTPAGTYPILVTATSPGLTRTATITLTVQ